MNMNENGDSKKMDHAAIEKMEMDIDADIKRLKYSSRFLAITLVALAVAFLILLGLSMSGYFEIQQTVGALTFRSKLYAVADNVQIFKEATEISEAIGTLSKKEGVFEMQRLPGFVQVQSGKLLGWVHVTQALSKLDISAHNKGIDNRRPLELFADITASQKDIVVSGKVMNHLEVGVKNIRLVATFYTDDYQIIQTEVSNLSPKDEIGKAGVVNFSLIGRDLSNKARNLTIEIEDFDIVRSTFVVEGSEGGSPEETPTPNQ
jgi:hypothetical protein